MIARRLLGVVNYFSTGSEPFLEFLSQKKPSIQVKRGTMRTALGMDISITRDPVSREEATEFMKKKGIINKKVLVNVDPSHAMGIRRILVKQFMETNVYKGHAEPLDVLTKDNPSYLVSSNQIIFDEGIFMRTDPIFIQRLGQKVQDDTIQDQLVALYNLDMERGGKRLHQEYSVPPEYVPIIEAAHNLDNTIYLTGLNEYEIRILLSAYLSLSQMKVFFMQALNYVLSIKESPDDLNKLFKYRCKEFMWKEHFSFWQPINYQQMMTFKRNIKGFCFAHPYNFIKPENPNINMDELVKDKEPDAAKIEKHAILSVLFGNIWGKQYTRDPFMYLSKEFHTMGQEDKETVNELYCSNYRKYLAAKNKFFQMKEGESS